MNFKAVSMDEKQNETEKIWQPEALKRLQKMLSKSMKDLKGI